MLAEYNELGVRKAWYNHNPQSIDGIISNVQATGKFYHLVDGLGSVYGLVNQEQVKVASYSYDAHGAVTDQQVQPGIQNPFLFTGRELDADSGLQYNRSRYYLSGVGSWNRKDDLFASSITSDENYQFMVVGTQKSNLFSYCEGKPVGWTDSSGYYGSKFHAYLTRAVMGQYGFSEVLIKAAVEANIRVDDSLFPNFAHGMRDVGQSPWDAFVLANNWIRTLMLDSWTIWDCDRYGAVRILGEALHTVQDIHRHKFITLPRHFTSPGYIFPELSEGEGDSILEFYFPGLSKYSFVEELMAMRATSKCIFMLLNVEPSPHFYFATGGEYVFDKMPQL